MYVFKFLLFFHINLAVEPAFFEKKIIAQIEEIAQQANPKPSSGSYAVTPDLPSGPRPTLTVAPATCPPPRRPHCSASALRPSPPPALPYPAHSPAAALPPLRAAALLARLLARSGLRLAAAARHLPPSSPTAALRPSLLIGSATLSLCSNCNQWTRGISDYLMSWCVLRESLVMSCSGIMKPRQRRPF